MQYSDLVCDAESKASFAFLESHDLHKTVEDVSFGDNPGNGTRGIHDNQSCNVVIRHGERRLFDGSPHVNRHDILVHYIFDLHLR